MRDLRIRLFLSGVVRREKGLPENRNKHTGSDG